MSAPVVTSSHSPPRQQLQRPRSIRPGQAYYLCGQLDHQFTYNYTLDGEKLTKYATNEWRLGQPNIGRGGDADWNKVQRTEGTYAAIFNGYRQGNLHGSQFFVRILQTSAKGNSISGNDIIIDARHI